MNRSRLPVLAALLAVPLLAAAQPPAFAPPGTPPPAAALLPPIAVPADAVRVPVAPPGPPPTAAARVLTSDGWLLGVQLDLITPHLGGSLASGPLNTTVSPQFLLGYRFPSGRSVQFEYRYFGSPYDAMAFLGGDPGLTPIHRHVEGHVFDLDIRFREGGWALLRSQWEVGARAANISIFASRPSATYFSLVSNRFEGVGPHLDYKLAFTVFDTGVEFFGRADVGVMFGSNRGFSRVPDPAYTGPLRDWRHDSDTAVVWNGRWQLGASYWFPWRGHRVELVGGYAVDAYLFPNAGQRTPSGGGPMLGFWSPFRYEPGSARLVNKGPFLRLEVKY